MTFGLVATRSAGYLLDFLDDAAAAGGRVIAQTHCRGISVLLSLKTKLPFDLLPAWHDLRRSSVEEQLRILGDQELRRALVDAAVHARVRAVDRCRRSGPPAGLRGHPGLPPRASPQPFGGRCGPAPGCAPRRSHDRPVCRVGRRPAVHPAQPLSPRRGGAAAGAAPSAGRHDVLGFRCASQPDRRLFDPHPSSGVLGARPPGVHAGGGRPDGHPGSRAGVGLLRPGTAARREWWRTSTSSTPTPWAPAYPGSSTTCPAGADASSSVRRDSWPRSSVVR